MSEIEFPAWYQDEEVPVTKQEIKDIFNDLTRKFGFQQSSKENVYIHLLTQLDSRASRTTAQQALISLHASYIGGDCSNYKKWYFAAQLDLDEEIGFPYMKLHGKAKKRNAKIASEKGISIKEQQRQWKLKQEEFLENYPKIILSENDRKTGSSYNAADYKWKLKMNSLTPSQMARQIALYLLIWGEANQLRFTPECLCFIFKCALDYDSSLQDVEASTQEEFTFLNNIITPIYKFLRDQVYTIDSQGRLTRKEKDHKDIIGYDDVNQLFWYPEGIERIILRSGERLVDYKLEQRYGLLKDVDWDVVFYKTYYETRTWLHTLTNFNRIWIIHFASFWFFTSFNSPTLYTKNYIQTLDNPPTPQSRFSAIALGGAITCLVQILATLAEWSFVPRDWPGAQHLSKRMVGLLFCFIVNFAPSVYVFGFFELDVHSRSAYIISIIQFTIAIFTTVFFSIKPLGGLFGSYLQRGKAKRTYVSSQTFTASFPELTGRSKWFSRGLWFCVFLCKFIESYFFLTLSLRDPIRALSTMDMSRCVGDRILGRFVCKWQSSITLFLMLITDLILFFLDTYLWYIICNCLFSIMLSFSLGTSILTPWKNIYSRLPRRIYTKILATAEMDTKFKPKILVSQIWNAIVISMYREHLISIDHVQRLLFQQVESTFHEGRALKSPTFFLAQDDSNFKSMEFFPRNSEAKRRISFFAQSLSTPITEPIPVECMPTFSVLIPHYSEKILLSLREIIKEESPNNKITLLEYLKQLHPTEWECFVRDSKLLAIENGHLSKEIDEPDYNSSNNNNDGSNVESNASKKDDSYIQEKISDLPFYSVGFNDSDPRYTLRTRIWASLRTQTLYRTISGFMNYGKAIKLLYRIENPSMVHMYADNIDGLESELESMARRKFKMVVAMQRYTDFNQSEREAVDFILKVFPSISISYLIKEKDPNNVTGEPVYYSCLCDGMCEVDVVTGLRKPRFKIRLSGNPILGDGKSDNQNHSIIFYRGEYIQVIDANQDNYLEECLKIRSILSEFEELEMENFMPYIPGIEYSEQSPPVGIVGAREYIFSENIGVLGDIAAGKEQTFGTLFARTLSEIGAKLHYGHPDFLNAIFMTTRGGISKAQKGLHLNEDIYAGMNVLCRGGRIKHSDYFQCGKGRDLGFNSILNFTTKIGAGMGEQLLSREYYYLGTQLPIDRFLSFFYAHPGFHLNNLFITMSVQLFFILLLNLGSLNHEVTSCIYDHNKPITDIPTPIGCYQLNPVLHWVTIFVLSIFIVFFIAFAPLLIQELLEKGIWKAFSRFNHHLVSLAPVFEVFVCQIYSHSLSADITFGDAKYIPTGRGFAITRLDFHDLYSRFAVSSIYSGSMVFLMLLFATLSIWQPALLWFWITVISLCLAPFIFNPHQFSFTNFFVDYRNLIRWFSAGNSTYEPVSWANFVKENRSRFTGYKRKMIQDKSESKSKTQRRPPLTNLFISEVLTPFFLVVFSLSAYCFINSQTGVKNERPTQLLIRLAIVTLFPIIGNIVSLSCLFMLSCFAGPILSCCCIQSSGTTAAIAHGFSVVLYLLDFEIMWFLEGWNFTRTLVMTIAVINIQNFIFKLFTIVVLSREYLNNKSHLAWWSGKWYNTKIGWSVVFQPGREFIVKVIESSLFAADFILCHFLLYAQTPIILIPFIDYWHSTMLFWLRPGSFLSRTTIYSAKQKKIRRSIVRRYFLLYVLILIIFLTLLVVPMVTQSYLPIGEELFTDDLLSGLIQPRKQENNDTGPNAPSTILRTTPQRPVFKTVA